MQDHVEASLKRIEDGQQRIEDKIDKIDVRVRTNEVEIATIKGRASTAGIVSGAVTGVASAALAYFGLGAR